MPALLDATSLSRLRWRCRRGLLENDLFVERFFSARGDAITVRQADGLSALMDLADNDLLDLLLRRKEPEGELCRDEVVEVLDLMRLPPIAAAGRPTNESRRADASPHGGDKTVPLTPTRSPR